MNKYYEIKVYEFNVSDIHNSNFIKRNSDREILLIAKKVPFGFQEIKTNYFIEDREIFIRNNVNAKNLVNYNINSDIAYKIENKGSIIITDTKYEYTYIQEIKDIEEIKEYLENFDKSKVKTIIEDSLKKQKDYREMKKTKKRKERINQYNNIKNNLEKNIYNIKEYLKNKQEENTTNNEIKKIIKDYKKGE